MKTLKSNYDSGPDGFGAISNEKDDSNLNFERTYAHNSYGELERLTTQMDSPSQNNPAGVSTKTYTEDFYYDAYGRLFQHIDDFEGLQGGSQYGYTPEVA